MTTQPLSFYASEQNFRRFESVIEEAVNAFPGETTIECPEGLSYNTTIARLRDAINSALRNKWKTSIDLLKLQDIRRNFICKNTGDRISIGPKAKDLAHAATTKTTFTDLGAQLVELTMTNASNDEVRAACTLLNGRHFSKLTLQGRFDSDFIKSMPTYFDVALLFEENQVVIV